MIIHASEEEIHRLIMMDTEIINEMEKLYKQIQMLLESNNAGFDRDFSKPLECKAQDFISELFQMMGAVDKHRGELVKALDWFMPLLYGCPTADLPRQHEELQNCKTEAVKFYE